MGTHWKKLTNHNFLGSWDFTPGEERILTISQTVQEEVVDMEAIKKDANAKKPCIVAHFHGNSKPMILNKTNCKIIQGLYGTPIIEEWAGKSIIVKVEKVRAFGKLEEALRIKNEKPALAKVKPILCADCKNEITGAGEYSAEQVATMTKKHYGETVCRDCSGKRKAASEASADSDAAAERNATNKESEEDTDVPNA